MDHFLYPRTLLARLGKVLNTDEILVIHGARQVGKTSLMALLKQSLEGKGKKTHYIDLEDSRVLRVLDAGVDYFIKHLKEEGVLFDDRKRGKVFIFIDEIQYLQDPSSFLKLMADHHREIKLIVSGSSSFAIKSKFKDSLVGRTLNFELFPLSFEEFLNFKKFSFTAKMLHSKSLTEKKQQELKVLFKEYSLYGGYPKVVLAPNLALKENYLQQIIDTYLKKDIRDLAQVRDIEKFNKLLEALASQSGQLLDVTELSNTCHLAKQTIEHYLFILENTYVIKRLRPYSGNLRSELFKIPKVYFYDTGIMQLLWLKQLQKEILGSVFETTIFNELIKKYSGENLFFWRTKDQKEIDFIVRHRGKLIPVEAKLNFSRSKRVALDYFQKKYKVPVYFITALRGELKGTSYLYPWQL